ncbi:metal ABC transporter ATP-binding protein [Psychromonas sp. 14N.309.X.WAT.B.A12]|uniref:metal ABC transporter ATP-binding protein n=1 Tax=Psychromonas sp. 14N.309.X.WAT.B.A12 TaxID=2998322 RepID=UPI0025B121A7|nr:metal ABC transporter ATP-binding protein [Psychromonas sp. 14N.309.X.WAT.B.A12]MDN2663316.1 metal ABC transporter ATP-binding protein [Psychromonas sp. 14N.309.X.WAT.B.A12]
MGPTIILNDVSLRYENNIILEKITATLEAGQCHVVMGPNGGGKTSLLRSILGLTPFKGDIEFQWQQCKGKIGYVPQKATFEPSLPLTVLDFILLNQSRSPLFFNFNKKHKLKALQQLARVGMEKRAMFRMGQLSGGEQQRVLFAQALLDDPDLLILDEPTNGMDDQGVRYFESLINDLVKEKKTILIVHHDISAVRRLQATVHVVNGILLESGQAEDVLKPSKIERLFNHYRHHSSQQKSGDA